MSRSYVQTTIICMDASHWTLSHHWKCVRRCCGQSGSLNKGTRVRSPAVNKRFSIICLYTRCDVFLLMCGCCQVYHCFLPIGFSIFLTFLSSAWIIFVNTDTHHGQYAHQFSKMTILPLGGSQSDPHLKWQRYLQTWKYS